MKGALEAIETYKRALGAEEVNRVMHPSGQFVWHAHLRIGDSSLFINDWMPEMGGGPTASEFWIYTERVDESFNRARDAGLEVVFPMTDQFWGDRTGTLKDRWGNHWSFAKRIKEMTDAEMMKAGEEFAKSQAQR